MLIKHRIYQEEANGEADGGSAAAPEIEEEVLDPELLAKGEKMGWTPKDKYKGDPAKWRPLEEFVERGENMLPIMKKTAERQERKIADLEKSIKEFAEYHTKTEQRAYERAFKELKTKQIQAVAAGDANAFVQIDKEIADLHQDAATKQPPAQQGIDPDYLEWAGRNRWVDSDPNMLAYAEAQGEYLKRTKPGLSYPELLEHVTKAVKKEFPDKFTNPRRESAPSVEGNGSVGKRGGKTYADLPADAKAACDRMVKNYGVKKEEYLKNYDWEA